MLRPNICVSMLSWYIEDSYQHSWHSVVSELFPSYRPISTSTNQDAAEFGRQEAGDVREDDAGRQVGQCGTTGGAVRSAHRLNHAHNERPHGTRSGRSHKTEYRSDHRVSSAYIRPRQTADAEFVEGTPAREMHREPNRDLLAAHGVRLASRRRQRLAHFAIQYVVNVRLN